LVHKTDLSTFLDLLWDYLKSLEFNRMELAGSLGDLGTMLPLLVPLIVINGLNATMAFLTVGFFYVVVGLYYRIPIPVQPLKILAVTAIATGSSAQLIATAGLMVGIFMLFLGATGLIRPVAKVFSKPVIRGVQVGLGLTLLVKGIQYIIDSKLFISGEKICFGALSLNLVVGFAGLLIAASLLTNKKIPAALVLVFVGFVIGLAFKTPALTFGPQISVQMPDIANVPTALMLLVLPQIPVTLSNSVVSTSDLAKKYFKKEGARASNRALASSVGAANVASGLVGGLPMCHGAGGLVSHYRFGARTGGANLMIGSIFITMALLFGSSAVSVLGVIPLSIMGVLLAFTGIQMMMLVADVHRNADLFVVFLIVGLSLAIDMAVAFISGIVVYYLLKWWSRWSSR
jgi:SulP family sulfate permease